MSAPGFVEHYPHPFHPIVDGQPDTSGTVEVFQLRPGDQQRLIAWSRVQGYHGADGGVLLLDAGRVVGQVALGDFTVRDGDQLTVVPAEVGFFQRYVPA